MKEIKVMVISKNNVEIKKDTVGEWITPESYVRGIRCWYSYGTKFVVKDDTGEIQSFMIVKVDDAVRGFTELIQLKHMNSLYSIFRLFELEV